MNLGISEPFVGSVTSTANANTMAFIAANIETAVGQTPLKRDRKVDPADLHEA